MCSVENSPSATRKTGWFASALRPGCPDETGESPPQNAHDTSPNPLGSPTLIPENSPPCATRRGRTPTQASRGTGSPSSRRLNPLTCSRSRLRTRLSHTRHRVKMPQSDTHGAFNFRAVGLRWTSATWIATRSVSVDGAAVRSRASFCEQTTKWGLGNEHCQQLHRAHCR